MRRSPALLSAAFAVLTLALQSPAADARRYDHDGLDYWLAPLVVGGVLLGAEYYLDSQRDRERGSELIEVPQEAKPQEPITWYWCESENAYYPAVRACPLGWTPVLGTSTTTPPAPPSY